MSISKLLNVIFNAHSKFKSRAILLLWTGKYCKADELASMGILFHIFTHTVNSKLKEIMIFMLAIK